MKTFVLFIERNLQKEKKVDKKRKAAKVLHNETLHVP